METLLVPPSQNSKQEFRILSLDGGGIRGAFIAACLARLERELNQPVIDYFDLVAGTSTGGLIALALALGERAEKILSLYKQHGKKIFTRRPPLHFPFLAKLCLKKPVLTLIKKIVRVSDFDVDWLCNLDVDWLRQTKYDQEALRSALTEVFGNRTLEEAKCRVVIPSVNLTAGQTVVFKSPHQPNFIRDRHISAVDVALATSAAPTYFPPAVIEEGSAYSDGGLWANSPSVVAYVEAIKIRELCNRPGIDPQFDISNISMLSIGTGEFRQFFKPSEEGLGLYWWGRRIFDLMSVSQSQGTDFQMQYVLGKRYYRVDFEMPDGSWALDSVEPLLELIHIGEQKAVEHWAKLQPLFFSTKANPYQPFPSV